MSAIPLGNPLFRLMGWIGEVTTRKLKSIAAVHETRQCVNRRVQQRVWETVRYCSRRDRCGQKRQKKLPGQKMEDYASATTQTGLGKYMASSALRPQNQRISSRSSNVVIIARVCVLTVPTSNLHWLTNTRMRRLLLAPDVDQGFAIWETMHCTRQK